MSTDGSRCRPTRSAASRRSRRAAAPARSGCTSSTSRTTRARRSTCMPRCASSTTSGPASEATTSIAGPGLMTANCRVRCWTTTGVFARDLRLRLLREHLDRAADGSEDDGLVDLRHRRRGDRGVGAGSGGLARRWPQGPPAAGPAASTPSGEARAADPVVGRSRRTARSTTPTDGPIAPGSRASGDLSAPPGRRLDRYAWKSANS